MLTAISIKQPFAHLIKAGLKTVECRSWKTSYRGQLLVCAGKKLHQLRPVGAELLPLGVSLCVVELADIRPMTEQDARLACLDWNPELSEKFAWVIRNPRPVKQVPVVGKLGLFQIEPHLLD